MKPDFTTAAGRSRFACASTARERSIEAPGRTRR